MIDPTKFKYTVAIMTPDKKQYDISDYIRDLNWAEEEEQLATRISFAAKNDKTSKGRISALAKPGCWIGILSSYNGGKNSEVSRGKIVSWNPSAQNSNELFQVKAYDILYDLQESQDDVYFPSGTLTKSAITQTLAKWKVSVGTYTGPNVKHGKTVYKTEKLGTVIIKLLKDARKKGGKDAVLRAVKNKVNVLAYGNNSTVYCFVESDNVISVNHNISTVGMVTRVKVLGKERDDGSSPVEATLNGQTSYGIRQRIITRNTNESLEDAKKEAQTILDDDGKPKETISVRVPDIPTIHKGDKVYLKTSTISAGYYFVLSVAHDCDSGTMTLDVKNASKIKAEDTKSASKKSAAQKTYKVGDLVTFKGGKHYVSSDASKAASTGLASGPAKITKTNLGSAHPYLLVTQNWNKTHVWGWCDNGSFS